jgi:hypothetical protein
LDLTRRGRPNAYEQLESKFYGEEAAHGGP